MRKIKRMSISCLFGFHLWELSRFVRLGSTGRTYQCKRCSKVVEHG